jgi:L-asparagine transporter-like permease
MRAPKKTIAKSITVLIRRIIIEFIGTLPLFVN